MQSQKKCIAVIACALLCCALLPLTAFAHSGRTDSRGGHYDYQMGLYHYHHGFPAHGHPDGVCPFNPNYEENLDKTAGMEHNDEWYWDEDKTQPENTEKAALEETTGTESTGKLSPIRKLAVSALLLLSFCAFGIVLYRLIKGDGRHDGQFDKHRRFSSDFFILLIPATAMIAAAILALIIWCFR